MKSGRTGTDLREARPKPANETRNKGKEKSARMHGELATVVDIHEARRQDIKAARRERRKAKKQSQVR